MAPAVATCGGGRRGVASFATYASDEHEFFSTGSQKAKLEKHQTRHNLLRCKKFLHPALTPLTLAPSLGQLASERCGSPPHPRRKFKPRNLPNGVHSCTQHQGCLHQPQQGDTHAQFGAHQLTFGTPPAHPIE